MNLFTSWSRITGLLVATAVVWCCSNSVVRADAVPENESWYLINYDGQPVGFEQVRVNSEGNDSLLSCFRKTELNMKRMGQHQSTKASLWTTQTKEGQLKSFRLQRIGGDGSRIERSGVFNEAKNAFVIEDFAAGSRRQFEVRAPSTTMSPLFTTWMPRAFQNHPQRQNVPVFFPETTTIAMISGVPTLNRQLRLNGRTLRVSRIEYAPELAPTKTTRLFANDELLVVQQEKLVFGRTLTLNQTTADVALGAALGKSLDIDSQAIVPIDRLLSKASQRRQLTLELSVPHGLLPEIPNSTFQTAQRISPTTARITLTSGTPPAQEIMIAASSPRSPLPSTRWMPTSDPTLQRMATFAAGAESDPAAICKRLTDTVHSKMRRSSFSTAMLPADHVAKTLRGDCTEHAILLATLVRIQGIPARVVSGLVHTDQRHGFVGHMWIEARLEDQWVPFDSTMGQNQGSATYIKLRDSELPDDLTSGVSLFLPILDLAGQAKIRVLGEQ